jgi:hypothetical protein
VLEERRGARDCLFSELSFFFSMTTQTQTLVSLKDILNILQGEHTSFQVWCSLAHKLSPLLFNNTNTTNTKIQFDEDEVCGFIEILCASTTRSASIADAPTYHSVRSVLSWLFSHLKPGANFQRLFNLLNGLIKILNDKKTSLHAKL